jgi:hypothetical protein
VLNKVGEELPSFLSRHTGMDNDIVARPPVRRGCHLVPISELKSWKKRQAVKIDEKQLALVTFNIQSTTLNIKESVRVTQSPSVNRPTEGSHQSCDQTQQDKKV